MNSARERGALRIRQATVALAGIGLAATGGAVALAHHSGTKTTSPTSSPAVGGVAGTGSGEDGWTGDDQAPAQAQPWQVGVGSGAPQAQSGGS